MERQIQMQTRQEPAASLTEGGRCLVFNLSIRGLGHSEVGATGLRGQTELGSNRSGNIPHPMESCPLGSSLEPHCFPCKRGLMACPSLGASGTWFGTVFGILQLTITYRCPSSSQHSPQMCVLLIPSIMLDYSAVLNNSLELGFPDMAQVYPADSSRKPICILMLFTQVLYLTLTDPNPTSTGLISP